MSNEQDINILELISEYLTLHNFVRAEQTLRFEQAVRNKDSDPSTVSTLEDIISKALKERSGVRSQNQIETESPSSAAPRERLQLEERITSDGELQPESQDKGRERVTKTVERTENENGASASVDDRLDKSFDDSQAAKEAGTFALSSSMDDAPDDADSQDIGTEQSNILDTSAGEEELAEKIVNVALSPVVRQKPNPDPKPVQEDKSGEEESGADEYSDDDDPGYFRIPVDTEDFFSNAEEFLQQHQDPELEPYEMPLDGSSRPVMKRPVVASPEKLEDGAEETETEKAAREKQALLAMAGQHDFSYLEPDVLDFVRLKVIYERNRTGFEESKEFVIELNSVIAGTYQVVEYLGSAAFSRAIQCIDLRDGSHVCIKIIKNNKDFFDQSLDEIKLLKYLNAHDKNDEMHVVQLYDFFYHKEHLFIVCELLRDNLYEFSKFNRESGAENYFNLPRLQKITRQCLASLNFIHSLFLIHCDLKPENVLIKSYSRCEIKIIDFGSSCFVTDHLSSYVQSRSYRAPEVILGMPYDSKIDMWSLGCILAELHTGQVLFQNDSVQTLLARVVGILGKFDPAYLERGRYMHKFFTKGYTLYEKRADGEGFVYIHPKKTSLRRRLKTDDENFVDFISKLLKVKPEERPTAEEAMQHPWITDTLYDFQV